MALTTAATGVISEPLQQLRTSLSNVDEFQDWTSTTNATDALAHIHIAALPPTEGDIYTRDDIVSVRPFAIVYAEPDMGNTFVYSGVSGPCRSYNRGGYCCIEFEQDVADSLMYEPAELDRQIQNTMGRMLFRLSTDASAINGLLDLSGTAGYLAINKLTTRGPWRSAVSDVSDAVSWSFELEWGNL